MNFCQWAGKQYICLSGNVIHSRCGGLAPPPSTPQMPLSSPAIASQSVSSSRTSVCSRKTSTCRDIVSCSGKQTQTSNLPCKTFWRMTQLGVSVLTHVTLQYLGQVMTLNIPVVNYTNVPLLRGYYVAARFQSDVCKLVPCHELVNIYCKPLRFWEKKWLIEAFSNYSNNRQDLFVYKERCTRKHLELISHREILTG